MTILVAANRGSLRSLAQTSRRSAVRRDQDRHADRCRPGVGRGAWSRRRSQSLSDQAVFTGAPALAGRERGAAGPGMAPRVGAAPGDDLTVAYRRLNAAYQQTLRSAQGGRRLYQQGQRAIYQAVLGLANAPQAKDGGNRGHPGRGGAGGRGGGGGR